MLILHPILPWLRSLVYWGTISTTVVSLLFIEAIKIYAANQAAKDNPTKVTYPATSPYPILFIQMQYTYPPLPSRYMVLSGVMLLQSFIGWIHKLGRLYWGFTDSMHLLGTNAYLMLQQTNKHSILITKRRIDRSLFVIMMAYMLPSAMASALHQISPSLQSIATTTVAMLPIHRPPQPPDYDHLWSFNLGSDPPDDASDYIGMPPLQDRASDASTCNPDDQYYQLDLDATISLATDTQDKDSPRNTSASLPLPLSPVHSTRESVNINTTVIPHSSQPLCLVTDTIVTPDVLILANSSI